MAHVPIPTYCQPLRHLSNNKRIQTTKKSKLYCSKSRRKNNLQSVYSKNEENFLQTDKGLVSQLELPNHTSLIVLNFLINKKIQIIIVTCTKVVLAAHSILRKLYQMVYKAAEHGNLYVPIGML